MYDMRELRAKNRQELLSLISELKGKLLALRFETATGQLTETHLIKNTKQDIAKIFTVLKEQEYGIVIKEKPLPEKSKKRFGKKSSSAHIEEIEHGDPAEAVAPLKEEPVVVEEKELMEAATKASTPKLDVKAEKVVTPKVAPKVAKEVTEKGNS